MELNYNLKALQFFGFIIPDYKSVRIFYMWISYLRFLPVTCLDILAITYYYNEPASVVRNIKLFFHSIIAIQVPFKWIFFAYKKKQLESLKELIDMPFLSESEEIDCMDAEVHLRSTRNIKRFSRLVFTYLLCSSCLVVIVPVLRILNNLVNNGSPQPLMVPIWWPSDTQQVPIYYFITLWQMAWTPMYVGATATTDAFVCALMLAASERAAMLARAAPQLLLPGGYNSVTPHFKAWLQYHQHYLRLTKDTNNTIGFYIFVTYFFTVVNIVLYSFLLISQNPFNFLATVTVMFNIIGLLIRTFIISYAGQTIIDQSVALRDSVVGVAQVTAGGLGAGPARSALQVLVTRLSGGAGPEHVNRFGFLPVTMETFATVLSVSVSYLLVLVQLNKA